MEEAVTLRMLPDSFGEHFLPYKCSLRQRINGRKFANEAYIESVKLSKAIDGEICVNSRIFHSQKKNDAPHNINIKMDSNSITEAHCTCKAGISGECAHVLAVVLKLTDWILIGMHDIPSQPACTSLPQQWDKPRGVRIASEPVSTMVLSRPGNTDRKKKPVTAVFIDNRNISLKDRDIEYLQSLEDAPLGYLASVPFQTTMTEHGPQNIGGTLAHQGSYTLSFISKGINPMPLIQPAEEPSDSVQGCGNLDFPQTPEITNIGIANDYSAKFSGVAVTTEEAIRIERNTRDQNMCDTWHNERKKRITASNFGRIMIRKSPVTQKLIESIMNAKAFTAQSTGYGIANEKVALNMYRKKTKNHVHECGFIINPKFPCIGATPDGKVCENGQSGILEIKCPFSVRDKTIIEAINARPDFFLESDGTVINLKKNHVYWFQVQGQLLITGAGFCDFVTYTRQDLHIVRILPHKDTMEAILSKMCNVFSTFLCKE